MPNPKLREGSAFTKTQIETILNKWSAPGKIKIIKDDPKAFFKAVNMKIQKPKKLEPP